MKSRSRERRTQRMDGFTSGDLNISVHIFACCTAISYFFYIFLFYKETTASVVYSLQVHRVTAVPYSSQDVECSLPIHKGCPVKNTVDYTCVLGMYTDCGKYFSNLIIFFTRKKMQIEENKKKKNKV